MLVVVELGSRGLMSGPGRMLVPVVDNGSCIPWGMDWSVVALPGSRAIFGAGLTGFVCGSPIFLSRMVSIIFVRWRVAWISGQLRAKRKAMMTIPAIQRRQPVLGEEAVSFVRCRCRVAMSLFILDFGWIEGQG